MQPKFSIPAESPARRDLYKNTKHTYSNTIESQQPMNDQSNNHITFSYPIVNFTQTKSNNASPDKPTIQPFRNQSSPSKDSFRIYNSSARRRINIEGGHIKQLQMYYNGLQQMVDLLKQTKRFLKDNEN